MDLDTTPIDQLPPELQGPAFGFVVNSWVRSWRRQSRDGLDRERFDATFPDVARRIAARGDVVMAHFEDCPELFIGWLAYDRACPNRVHYTYVKQNFSGKVSHATCSRTTCAAMCR